MKRRKQHEKLYSFPNWDCHLSFWSLSGELATRSKRADTTESTVSQLGDYIDANFAQGIHKETGIQGCNTSTFDSNRKLRKIHENHLRYCQILVNTWSAKMMDEDIWLKKDWTNQRLKGWKISIQKLLNQSFDRHVFSHWLLGEHGDRLQYQDGLKMLLSIGVRILQAWRGAEMTSDVFAREVMGIGLNTLGYSLSRKGSETTEGGKMKLYQKLWFDEMKRLYDPNNAAIEGYLLRRSQPNARSQ